MISDPGILFAKIMVNYLPKQKSIDSLVEQLIAIRAALLAQESKHQQLINGLHPNYRISGKNLIHYLTLRTFDLRKLQEELANLGLSSIGSSERYNLTNIEHIISFLICSLPSQKPSTPNLEEFQLNYFSSKQLLDKNTQKILGDPPKNLQTHIMVTLPSEAATDKKLVKNLITHGMTIARINCGHDNEQTWQQIIQAIKKAEKSTGKNCRICMDIGGPKLRTGAVERIVKKKKKKEKVIDYLRLWEGDLLELHRKNIIGKNAHSEKGKSIPAKISTTLPAIFRDVKTGDRILFDDGKIIGKIINVKKDTLLVKIKRASKKGSKLRMEKGINLPDTVLRIPCPTKVDLCQLPFITKHADLIGFSFVNHPKDIARLQTALKKLNREDLGIILKIETDSGFNHLPSLLFQAMKSPSFGVMTARGDLAVEIGWERMAEVQEEILWLCEAALIPNIWATQVLDNLAKNGLATRAEITDAAMSTRAECVMLNKGPYILEAIKSLTDILQRMESHSRKRKGALRPLKVAKEFLHN